MVIQMLENLIGQEIEEPNVMWIRFKINPNKIKELRTGEFIIYRTAENVNLPPQKVYVRNALNWLKNNSKI